MSTHPNTSLNQMRFQQLCSPIWRFMLPILNSASCRIGTQCGGCSSVVELRTVAPAVEGSNPSTHPISLFIYPSSPTSLISILAVQVFAGAGRSTLQGCYGEAQKRARTLAPDTAGVSYRRLKPFPFPRTETRSHASYRRPASSWYQR